ncbi:MAG TPA: HU family DNA-binding protein [Candidatus Parabacteroides intestinigallinarum]|uniref:HU family DNA-binding protein n=1 Tax=Candidatus Parabacteroides intestinigallinarum TaxID=2838722 RepID=A0A9D1XQF5_9BACT|nr:HU family DNA-binding protein [Candidatus Parabacteroides intestinigallinarum]
MALRVRRIKKAFGFDKTKTEKYVIVPDRATVVTFDDLCEQIATVSGVNNSLARHVLYGLVSSMKTFIRQGHSVQVEGFGTFIPSFNAKSSLIEDEANIDSITKVKLRFLPSTELREVINSMEFEFDAADSTNDSQAESETDPEGGTASPSEI